MANVAIYARVSTTKQDTDRQVEECRDSLTQDELENHTLYADVGSGTTTDREDLQRLLDDVEAGEINKIVAWELSRIGRNLAFVADFIDTCVDESIELVTLHDMFPGLRGDGDLMDKMMGQFVAWMMEFEAEMIRERVQSGVTRAMEQGKWVGRPPYGFTTNDDGYLQVNAEEYHAMQLAVERVLTTDDSVNSIAKAFDVPQSSLDRIAKDEDRRELYLFGESEDERVQSALEEKDEDDKSTLSQVEARLSELEAEIDDS